MILDGIEQNIAELALIDAIKQAQTLKGKLRRLAHSMPNSVDSRVHWKTRYYTLLRTAIGAYYWPSEDGEAFDAAVSSYYCSHDDAVQRYQALWPPVDLLHQAFEARGNPEDLKPYLEPIINGLTHR